MYVDGAEIPYDMCAYKASGIRSLLEEKLRALLPTEIEHKHIAYFKSTPGLSGKSVCFPQVDTSPSISVGSLLRVAKAIGLTLKIVTE